MRYRQVILFVIALLSLSAANASAWGTVQVTINGYYVYSSGSAYFTTSNNQNPDNCASTRYLYVDTGQAFFKEMYATLMTARASGETVTLLYDGCVGPYPRISAIAVPAVW